MNAPGGYVKDTHLLISKHLWRRRKLVENSLQPQRHWGTQTRDVPLTGQQRHAAGHHFEIFEPGRHQSACAAEGPVQPGAAAPEIEVSQNLLKL